MNWKTRITLRISLWLIQLIWGYEMNLRTQALFDDIRKELNDEA